jgi:methionyl-tRNA formyltransferase
MKKGIVFLGTSAFALPSLTALVEDDHFEIQCVITQPDRPVGRKQIITPPPVKEEALKRQLRVLQPENMNQWFREEGQKMARPDFVIVVSYGQLLSNEVLAWPTVAPINVHASLLPLLRGASPLQHSILENHQKTGVTIQRMVKALDAGPILAQKIVEMQSGETFTSLHDRLALLGGETLKETLLSPFSEQEQDEKHATFCGKIKKEDGIISLKTFTAQEIDRRVRALTPWPGVQIENGIKLLSTSLIEKKGSLSVKCKEDTTLFILTIQPPGKNPMSGHSFSLGYPPLS